MIDVSLVWRNSNFYAVKIMRFSSNDSIQYHATYIKSVTARLCQPATDMITKMTHYKLLRGRLCLAHAHKLSIIMQYAVLFLQNLLNLQKTIASNFVFIYHVRTRLKCMHSRDVHGNGKCGIPIPP